MRYIILLLSVVVISGCSHDKKSKEQASEKTVPVRKQNLSPFDSFAWMEGNWKLKIAEGELHEDWKRVSDSLYEGEGYLVNNEGKLPMEKMYIRRHDGAIHFVAIVFGENEGKPVYFRLISNAHGEYVFENPEHDFPTRIIYRRSGDGGLTARIEGKQKKKQIREEVTLYK